MTPTRRAVGVGLLAAAGCAQSPSGDPFAADKLGADVRAYAAFGVHRSGGAADRLTADWLVQRLTRVGYDARRGDIAIDTVLEPWADVRAGVVDTRAFVQLFAPDAAWGDVIEAPLVLADQGAALNGAIAVVAEPAPASAYWPADHDGPVHALATAGARAVILNVAAPNGDIYVLNRDIHAPRFPIPVLVVGAETHAQLMQAAGSPASVTIGGPLAPAQTHIVSARKSGRGRGIVVSTPLTGWFTCGAERGPGVALLLALGEALRDVDAPVVLLGTGGHEIGHIGMDQATESAPSPDDVALWIHLGSSIASLAAPGSDERNPMQYTFVSAAMAPLAQRLLGPVAPQVVEVGADGPGETGQVIGAGYARTIGFAGAHRDFHTPQDDGSLCDPAWLAQIGAAVAQAAREALEA